MEPTVQVELTRSQIDDIRAGLSDRNNDIAKMPAHDEQQEVIARNQEIIDLMCKYL